ncbi:Zinc finger Rad18-type [Penicillium sp. DV-2018c]|nr:Zinc finger Rad18-type [Penicillium sp. DV-2018c]
MDMISVLHCALRVEGTNYSPSELVGEELVRYFARFADGDARTSLDLLELAMDLSKRPGMDREDLTRPLITTLVYDRAGDQYYDNISAFHKSVRGSDPDAALYYLAGMIQSDQDPWYITRRLIVVASKVFGFADTLNEPGIAGLPIPIHLRKGPTKVMKERGYGAEYKYNPHYVDGKVQQDYLPEKLLGRTFLEDLDLGTKRDPELNNTHMMLD